LAFLFASPSRFLSHEHPSFFAESDTPCAGKRNAKAWAKVHEEIEQLKNIAPGQAVVANDLPVKIAR
jgi:hypothetical protein